MENERPVRTIICRLLELLGFKSMSVGHFTIAPYCRLWLNLMESGCHPAVCCQAGQHPRRSLKDSLCPSGLGPRIVWALMPSLAPGYIFPHH